MKKIVTFLQVLDNLTRMPRLGGVMFAGIDPNRSDSVAEHIFKVNCAALFLSQLAQSNGFEIRMEKLLKASITHDWNESILLDIPSGSPSFQSYFKGTNIRETVKKAEETALTTMEDYLKEEIDITLAHHDLNTDEKSILQMADVLALLIEILEWKYEGLKYEWIDYMWSNTLNRLQQFEKSYPYIQTMREELHNRYESGIKPANPFLTKQEYQSYKK